jgi:hypothetical protein
MTTPHPLGALAQEIFELLGIFYPCLQEVPSPQGFLLAEDLVVQGDPAQVLILEGDTLDLAISLPHSLSRNLLSQNPLQSLNSENLNGFWILVEEISHFCLLCTRASQGDSTTYLELEWQGEIDKILLASLLLYRQQGDFYTKPLVHKLFCETVFTSPLPVYREANFYAGQFWYQGIRSGLGRTFQIFHPDFLKLLIENYQRPMGQKRFN